MTEKTELIVDDQFLVELIENLGIMSLEADTLEIAKLALRLQVELKKTYGQFLL